MKRTLTLLLVIISNLIFSSVSKAQCKAGFEVYGYTCTRAAVSFTDSTVIFENTSDSLVKEIWEYGDGKSDTLLYNHSVTKTHNYLSNGTFTVKLTAFTYSGCIATFSKNITVTIKPQAAYYFTPVLTHCVFDSVLFYNQSTISTGEPLSLLWHFYDDNTTGTKDVQNHRYYNQGIYQTSLTVTAQNGCVDSLQKQIGIIQPTKAAFTVKYSGCANDSVSIIENSFNGVASSFYSKTWYFGDGTSQIDYDITNKTVKHLYSTPGKYHITLKFETSSCLQYCYDSVQIGSIPRAAFSTSPGIAGLCGLQQMNFINRSSPVQSQPLTYQWKINNSATDTTADPSYNFTDNGIFPVKLTATQPSTGCSYILDTTVTVSGIDPKPFPDFAFETDSANLLKYNFYDSTKISSTGSISSYTWLFGDGSDPLITSAKNVSHTYTQKGPFSVKCIVSSLTGCSDSTTKIVKADSTPVVLCVSSYAAPTSVCLGAVSNFADYTIAANGADSLIKQIWNFGDGLADTLYNNFATGHSHLYTAPGNYSTSLTILTKRGCTNSATRTTTVRSTKLKSSFSYLQIPNCASSSQTIQFRNTTQNYFGSLITKWIFGDGNTTTGELNPLHAYAAPGNYTVQFLSRVSGCMSTYDTITKIITILPRSKSGMLYSMDNSTPKTILFSDQSTSGFENITGWGWDFGDSVISSEQNPTHTYTSYGTFTVKHFLNSVSGCTSDTTTIQVHIDSFITSSANTFQSSIGTDFWTGFGYIENMRRKISTGTSLPTMSVYLAADKNPATVMIDIPAMSAEKRSAFGFPRMIYVPADSVVEVSGFPTGDPNDPYNAIGASDTRLYYTGISNRAIHITSNQPIGAWQHVFSTNNTAGGSLLIPAGVWSTSYIVQSRGGKSNTGIPNSFFFVIAERDSTIVQFIPSNDIVDSSSATIFTDNHPAADVLYKAGNTYSVLLNRGQVFNAMGFVSGSGNNVATAVDLSGTKVVSTDPFKKIAVFGGNGRVLINTAACNNTTGSDNLIQQMFPKAAWGTRYLTTPAKTMEYCIYRITVSDTSTNVTVNGSLLARSTLKSNAYYEIENNTPNIIESDKRVMVTQYVVTPGCPASASGNNGTGDPEMINLTPLKYATNNVTIYSANIKTTSTVNAGYINIVIKKEGISGFTIDNSNMVDTGASSYNTVTAYLSSGNNIPVQNAFVKHPGDNNYYYAKIFVTPGRSHQLKSDSLFTAIAYGMGNGESYGYNAGFNFNAPQLRYEYLGSGKWTDEINWLGHKIPPNPLPMGSEIIVSGKCTLNVPQTIEDGARLIVETGGNLVVNGNLIIQQ